MELVLRNKKYKIINSASIQKSSRELKYTDITIDFTGATFEDLPLYFQEGKVIDENGNVIFLGYIESYKLPTLNISSKIHNELTITFMTPRKLATKKTVTIFRTDSIKNIIDQILQPLYVDGYKLKECILEDKAITVQFISKTVEEAMKILASFSSFWWYINEKKEIYIYSTDYLFNKPAKKSININNYRNELKGFINIEPTVEGTDYANIINLKNARIFYYMLKNNISITMKKGDTLEFENPVDISLDTAKRLNADSYFENLTFIVANLSIGYGDNEAYIYSAFNSTGDLKNGVNFQNIGKTDDENKTFTLVMDPMFTNLATGIKYNGEKNITVDLIQSETALRYATAKLINWHEIEKNKGIITVSGQIEKTIDASEKWFTVREIIDFIKTKFTENDKFTNTIKIELDKNNNLEIGDRIEFNFPELFTVGNFIITDITESVEGNNDVEYRYELRNTALSENYIDLFKEELTAEEQTNQVDIEYVVEYAEEETIVESHTIEQDTGGTDES